MPTASVEQSSAINTRSELVQQFARAVAYSAYAWQETESDPCLEFEAPDVSEACHLRAEGKDIADKLSESMKMVLLDTEQSIAGSPVLGRSDDRATWLLSWNDLYEGVFDVDAEESSAALARERSFRLLFPRSFQDVRSRFGC